MALLFAGECLYCSCNNFARVLMAISNIENPYERYTKEQSLKGIAEWFNFWLSH